MEKYKSELEELAKKCGLDINSLGPEKYVLFDNFCTILSLKSERKDRELDKIINKNKYDSLTGLENRYALNDFLIRNTYRADRHDEDLSILMIDADNFKLYNDSYGHIQGDNALVTISHIVRNSIRKEDLAVRYGGEEISLVLPETSQEDAEGLAERIREKVEETIIPKNKSREFTNENYKHVTVSLGLFIYHRSLNEILGNKIEEGISLFNEKITDEDRVKALINEADMALYKAKEDGRNRYCIANLE